MTPDAFTTTFSALADPTRRAILARLSDGEASVTELASMTICVARKPKQRVMPEHMASIAWH